MDSDKIAKVVDAARKEHETLLRQVRILSDIIASLPETALTKVPPELLEAYLRLESDQTSG